MFISSRANPVIKNVRMLRQRKFREETGHYYIEGIRLVVEAVKSGAKLENLLVAPSLLTSPFAIEFLEANQNNLPPVLTVSEDVFRSFALKENPQGLAAVVRQKWSSLAEIEKLSHAVSLALTEIQDPGNLGSILRTADAVGLSTIFLLGNCTDPYDPATLRASMGAVFGLHFVKLSFEELKSWAAEQKIKLVGASGEAKVNYRAASYEKPLVLLTGSEQHGLTGEQQNACDFLVRIPMKGSSDSLNLAIATSILLYEIFTGAEGGVPQLE